MEHYLSEEIVILARQLIHNVIGLKEIREDYKRLEKHTLKHLKQADSMYFLNHREINNTVASLAEKFIFHGFENEAKLLQKTYEKYMSTVSTSSERNNALNVVKFIICMSNSPTNNIEKFPRKILNDDHEEVVNWPEYLKEGIPRWVPELNSDSSEWSDSDSEINFSGAATQGTTKMQPAPDLNFTIHDVNTDFIKDYTKKRRETLQIIQRNWFNQGDVRILPNSSWSEANVAISWENYLEQQVHGLISIPKTNIITEYQIMREIVWQLWEPHESLCFKFCVNKLVISPNFTISSARPNAVKIFLNEFLPYIQLLNDFRTFSNSLSMNENNSWENNPPDTYRSYADSIQTIINPIYKELIQIEDTIRKQETTTTLLRLSGQLRNLFKPIEQLKEIHENVILDHKTNSNVKCATNLLVKLHDGLLHSSSKLEQDLYLTLYLGSLRKYLTVIDRWLTKDELHDAAEEFVIVDSNPKEAHRVTTSNAFHVLPSSKNEGHQDWQMEFMLRQIDENVASDCLLKLICTRVLNIGKNVHLLRLMGKMHLINENYEIRTESVYEDLVMRVLKEISMYVSKEEETENALIKFTEISDVCTDFVLKIPGLESSTTELSKIENSIDITDGFCMKAFASYFVEKPKDNDFEENVSLFEKISRITTNLFPTQYVIDRVFSELLKDRFTFSGLIVKNLLINENNLEQHLNFLQHIFLFKDDLISNFYHRIFQQMDTQGPWGNDVWLTSHLQDLLMDHYPNFYENCSVQVREDWRRCSDPLKACGIINLHYIVHWPLNIIIRKEHLDMYRDLFKFIMNIKWALYTLNHLYFCELKVNQKKGVVDNLMKNLNVLRFSLLHTFSNIQHYVFGYLYSWQVKKFELNFEKSWDIDSLVKAHEDFVKSLHGTCMGFKEFKSNTHGFCLLLYLVRKLRLIWRKEKEISGKELKDIYCSYRQCVENIENFIVPTYNTL